MVRRYREVKTIVLIAVLLASIAGTGHAEEPKFIDLQVKAWALGALEVGAFHGYCAKVTILETGASNYTYGSDSAMFYNISVDAYPNVTAIVNAPYENCWSSQPQLVPRANTTVNETIDLLAAYNNNESLHTEIITVSGFVITVEIPSNGSTFSKGDNITIRTRVEYMCGCPSGCGSWEEDRDYPPAVTITYSDGSKEEFSLCWAGSCWPDPTLPLYNASYVLSSAGTVTINVSMKKGPYDNNMTNYGEHVITIDVVDNAPPTITFAPPTDANGGVVDRNWTYINVTLDEDGSSVWLEWNGTNESLQGSGANWHLNKTGLANGNYTYSVWANDSVGNLNVSETRIVTVKYIYLVLEAMNFTLDQGWNLISIPLEHSNWSITSVLASIEGKYTVVFEYSDGGWKRSTAPRVPLTDMSREYGYWVNMTEPATLELNGTVPSVTTINVTTGWNLVSYPSLTVQNLTTVLSPINYTAVFEYRDGIWGRSTALRDPLTNMSPGYGYWVNASEAGSYGVD